MDCINNDVGYFYLKKEFDKKVLIQSGLLSLKPKIFVCNVDERSIQNGNNYTKAFINKYGQENTLIVSADIENQINELDLNEKNYMEMIGLKKTGLDLLIQKGYKILELDTFFTSGPEETRAWTIEKIAQLLKQLEKFIRILKKVSSELKQFLMKTLLLIMVGLNSKNVVK